MSRVTSKLQVTVPKAIADRYRIRPGDEIEWVPAGDAIRIVPPAGATRAVPAELRLKMFDAATERQDHRQARQRQRKKATDRGWTRKDLYERGRPG